MHQHIHARLKNLSWSNAELNATISEQELTTAAQNDNLGLIYQKLQTMIQ